MLGSASLALASWCRLESVVIASNSFEYIFFSNNFGAGGQWQMTDTAAVSACGGGEALRFCGYRNGRCLQLSLISTRASLSPVE